MISDLMDLVAEKNKRIEELEKDRHELIEKIKAIKEVLNIENVYQLQKENVELKEQKQDLCKSLDIMNNREKELLEQIEKMKCCGNCKHWIENLDKLGEPYFSCEVHSQSSYCENYNKWELAENEK